MRSTRVLILVASLAGVLGCGAEPRAPEPPTPESVVHGLFELARENDPDPARVEALFGAVDDGLPRAALADAIRALPVDAPPEIVESYALDGRTGFDLEGSLTGGGAARYTVLLDTTTAPGVIVWFSGPGVEWPERRRRGPGISTSAPPPPLAGG